MCCTLVVTVSGSESAAHVCIVFPWLVGVACRSIELPSEPEAFRNEVMRAGIALSTTDSSMRDTLTRGRTQAQQGAAEKKRAVKKRRRGVELRTNAHLRNDTRFQMPSMDGVS